MKRARLGRFQLEIAGSVAQEPKKLVSGDEELKRTRMEFTLHNEWITQMRTIRHGIRRVVAKSIRKTLQLVNPFAPHLDARLRLWANLECVRYNERNSSGSSDFMNRRRA